MNDLGLLYREAVEVVATASLGATIGETDRSVRVSRLLQSIRDALNGIDLEIIPILLDDDHIGTEILRLDNSDLIPFGTKDKSLHIASSEGDYELNFEIARFRWGHGVPSEGQVLVAPGTSPTSWYTTPENVQHIAYVGTDQKIHECFFLIIRQTRFEPG
jgi:hypothetical protein